MYVSYKLGASKIHGEGIFCINFIKAGSIIYPNPNFVFKEFRGFNHSCTPNLEIVVVNGEGQSLIATKDILPGEEIVVNYLLRLNGLIFVCNCGNCS